MHHLVFLSFLVFSVRVNSFPRDLQRRYPDEFDLAYSPGGSDSSIFTDDTSADWSSDPSGSTFLTADASGLANTDYLGEPSLLDASAGVDLTSTPSDSLVAITSHEPPTADFECPSGTQRACCYQGKPSECIWFSQNDPLCYYASDWMCCNNIDGLQGIDCSAAPTAQSNPIQGFFDNVEGFLRLEVPTGWIEPLVGGAGSLLESHP